MNDIMNARRDAEDKLWAEYAGIAMQGLLARPDRRLYAPEEMASRAFAYANAMMQERALHLAAREQRRAARDTHGSNGQA